jgi:diguanylate cyclase (GGDEF)-like protein
MIAGMLWVFQNIINEISQEIDSSFYQAKLLLPFVIIIILFILFVFSTNRMTQLLIFVPLKQLVDSLLRLRESNGQEIFGIERDDEIGLLSNTIQDLFIKGHYDSLTGIFNRRYLELTMQHIMSTLSRTESQLSVIMADVDFFKKYNDTYGHGKGDECLKAIAQALVKVTVRSGDFAARYGGEEFAVVLPGTNETGARIIGDKMLKAIQDLEIPHEKNFGGIVTISIGITTGCPTHTQNWKDYFKKADDALYLSKNNGRNRSTYLFFKDDAEDA